MKKKRKNDFALMFIFASPHESFLKVAFLINLRSAAVK